MEKKGTRYVFIDALRGLAVFAMLECHVLNAIMSNNYEYGTIFNLLNVLNGFISVGFLFFAGSGFWIAAQRKSDDYKHFRKPLWGYLRRLGWILTLAYFIHLPVLSVFNLFNLDHQQVLIFAECDVLQTIVISSVFALILLLLTPSLKFLKYLSIALAIGFFFLTPLIWHWDPFTIFPTMIGSYFAPAPVSKFPLFPWSGYFFAGVAFTALFFDSKNKEKFAKIGIAVSLILGIILLETNTQFTNMFGWKDWWQGFPTHSLFRTSGIILIFCISYLFEEKLKNMSIGRAFALVGQESLLVYIGHLMIVYGSVVNYGFIYMLGPRAHPLCVALITVVMCIFFYYASLCWNTIKREKSTMAHSMLYAISALVLSVMFLF
jgi:uncharacterized membrane protein